MVIEEDLCILPARNWGGGAVLPKVTRVEFLIYIWGHFEPPGEAKR